MGLPEIYPTIKQSLVAFMSRVFESIDDSGNPPPFPPIIGTGFIIHENGVVATNQHVVAAFEKLPKHPGATEQDWPVVAMCLKPHERGIVEIPLTVVGVITIGDFQPAGVYYGPKKPDIAFVHVKARELPTLNVDVELQLKEGIEVATAGFPMGRDALMAPWGIHQINPTLQTGIVSSVMPFPCPTPHAFAINVVNQPGASGSPVFLPDDGRVVGVVNAILQDIRKSSSGELLAVPTAITHVVPAHYFRPLLNNEDILAAIEPSDDTATIDEMIARAKLVDRFEDEIPYVPLPADQVDDAGRHRLAVRTA